MAHMSFNKKTGLITCSKFRYGTFHKLNNKDADQDAQAGLRLCCLKTPKKGIFASRPI